MALQIDGGTLVHAPSSWPQWYTEEMANPMTRSVTPTFLTTREFGQGKMLIRELKKFGLQARMASCIVRKASSNAGSVAVNAERPTHRDGG